MGGFPSPIRLCSLPSPSTRKPLELAKELLAKIPNIVAEGESGNAKAAGALIGEAKKMNPKIDPGEFRELCLKLIEE